MKTIYAYGIDSMTVNRMKENQLEVISVTQLPNLQDVENDLLLLSGETISIEDLEKLRNDNTEVSIAYLDSEESIRRSVTNATKCAVIDVTYFAGKATAETITSKIQELFRISDMKNSRVVGFFGSGTGVGTTTVSVLFAKRFAAAGLKVAHLGLDLFDPGWERKPTSSLDTWRPRLTAKIVQLSDFNELIEIDGVRFLPGNFDYLSAFDYRVEDMEYLLEKAQEAFDVVVADFGSIAESAAWYVGMQWSGNRIMVTHHEHEHRLQAILDTIEHLELTYSDFFGVFNRSNPNVTLGISAREVERFKGLQIIADLPIMQVQQERTLPIGKKELQEVDTHVRHQMIGMGFKNVETKGRR